MPLPILAGILGAGLLTQGAFEGVAKPTFRRRQGERRQGILDALGPDASLDEQIAALDAGGLLRGEFADNLMGNQASERDFLEQMRINEIQNEAAMARQQVASGAGYMAQARADAQWAASPNNPESPYFQDPNAPFDPAKDRAYQQWQAQQDYLRENPTIDQTIDQQQADFERMQAQAKAAQATLAQQEEFIQQAQPLQNQLQVIDYADSVLGNVNLGPRWWQSVESRDAVDTINQLIFAQRNAYKLANYGETEPPPAVLRQIAEMFPMLDNATWRNAGSRRTIQQNLQRYRKQVENTLSGMESSMTRRGITIPQVAPQQTLPDGYERVQ